MYLKIINILFILGVCSSNADDRFYDLGKKFLYGEAGSVVEKKIINNCPYEACKLNDDKVREIDVSKPNVKSGISLLEQSVLNTNNTASASLIVSHLLDQIDYKDKEQSVFLIKKIEKDYGLNEAEYKNKIKKYVDFLVQKKTCEGYYYYGQLSSYGYVYKKDNNNAIQFLQLAIKNCGNNMLFYSNAKSSYSNFKNINNADW